MYNRNTVRARKLQRTPEMAKKKKNLNPRKTSLILAALTPALIIAVLQLQARYQLITQRQETVHESIKEYSYRGWHVDDLLISYEEEYTENKFIDYLLEETDTTNIDQYETELHNMVDNEKKIITEAQIAQKRDSARFYIDEISQDTADLESYFEDLDEGLDTNNYHLISSSLSNIEQEITALDKSQEKDIESLIQRKVDTVKSIHRIGQIYGLDFTAEVNNAQSIAQKDIDPLEKFTQLDELKTSSASELDQSIIANGGRSYSGKRIFISISQQRLYMVEDYNIVHEMPASTGKHGHGTGVGEFQVYDKDPMVWGYYDIWMPYWITVYYSGGLKNGIHGIPISPASGRWSHWDGAVGNYPITYGCIMPHDWDAEIVFDWADVGIPVSILY